jgi:outer membrane immunogenic protein
MRKLVIFLLCAASAPAFAADLPSAKAPPMYTPPPPVFSWTGGYIGAQAGIQFGQTSWDRYDPTNTVFLVSETPYATNGAVGGGHIGYNFQMSEFVIGVEGDVEGTNYNGNGASINNSWANTTRSNIEASIRGRVGYAWDHILIYGTGGVAYQNFHLAAQTPPGVFFAGDSFDRIGWTVGGGIEYAIDDNWSLRGEYRFTDYGHHDLFTGTENVHEGLWNNRFEAGVSYKFDFAPPPPPVVAKY